jgi:cysteine desulfurase/selenocysteine lyase
MQPDRRSFLRACGIGVLAAPTRLQAGGAGQAPGEQTDAASIWRREFPALEQHVNGHPLAYLDSAATTLRPRRVIEAITRFYATDNANPSASLHTLARRAAEQQSSARARIARFLNAAGPNEIVVTRGTTEAINLVAATWGSAHIGRGDEIVLTVAEHYSNLLPWRALAQRVGARIVLVDVDDEGRVHPERIDEAITARTRLVAFSHVSNVLGILNPAPEICRVARRRNVTVLIDAAQSAPHVTLDVQSLGCDFLACSGHKLLGPMGTGVLWANQAMLDGLPPYQLGSNMAHEVDQTTAQYEHGALKYQAGTPNVSGTIGLAAALDVLEHFDMTAIRRHDAALVRHLRDRLAEIPGVRVLGTLTDASVRLPVFTFTLPEIPVAMIVKALDARGVAVRAGDMAALPLLKRFGVTEAVRASGYLYTTTGEVDRLIDGLRAVVRQGL